MNNIIFNKFKLYSASLTTFAALSIIPLTAQANNCWSLSAQKHKIDPLLLMAYGTVESSLRGGIESRNTNGSYDLGIMQINTIHLPYFKKMGYSRSDLKNDNCKNIMAAGYLVKDSFRRYGYNINGIGGYHSNTPHLRLSYAKKVLREYNKLLTKHRGQINNPFQQIALYGGNINNNKLFNNGLQKTVNTNNQMPLQRVAVNRNLNSNQTKPVIIVRKHNSLPQKGNIIIRQSFSQNIRPYAYTTASASNQTPTLIVRRFPDRRNS